MWTTIKLIVICFIIWEIKTLIEIKNESTHGKDILKTVIEIKNESTYEKNIQKLYKELSRKIDNKEITLNKARKEYFKIKKLSKKEEK